MLSGIGCGQEKIKPHSLHFTTVIDIPIFFLGLLPCETFNLLPNILKLVFGALHILQDSIFLKLYFIVGNINYCDIKIF
jgi:hypothetical protein